jgi:hypothetical protein
MELNSCEERMKGCFRSLKRRVQHSKGLLGSSRKVTLAARWEPRGAAETERDSEETFAEKTMD